MNLKPIFFSAGMLAVTLFFVQSTQAQSQSKGDRSKADRAERGAQKGGAEKRRERPSPEKLIERFDADGDGSLAVAELPERLQKRFEKVDTDADGFVSAEELTTAFENRQGKGKAERGGKGKGKEKGERGVQGKGERGVQGKGERGVQGKGERGEGKRSIDPSKLLQRMDKDGDEKISLEEAPDRFKKNFSKMDTNADDFVELNELTVALEMMQQKRGNKSKGKGKRKGAGDLKPVEPKLPPTDVEL